MGIYCMNQASFDDDDDDDDGSDDSNLLYCTLASCGAVQFITFKPCVYGTVR